jgi:hypothetical protein
MGHEPRFGRKGEPAACPFCSEKVPRPGPVEPALGPRQGVAGGRCRCGALYLLDATGKEGGQVLVDGLALLYGGDLSLAMSLAAGTDYEVKDLGYNPRGHNLEPLRRGRAFGIPKLWFFRRLRDLPGIP